MFKSLLSKFKKNKVDSRVTSLAEMAQSAFPVVAISAWDGAGEIKVQLRRVTMMSLVESGELPNELLAFAQDVALKEKQGKPTFLSELNPETYEKYSKLLHVMARAALVSPTYDEIVGRIGPLTDQQLMEIHFFCLGGVRTLHSFRKATGFATSDGGDSEDIWGKTE